MRKTLERPAKSKKEFQTFVHRDDLSNEELVKYLKKKGLSFDALKCLVEQALEKQPDNEKPKDGTEKTKKRRKKHRFPPIQDGKKKHQKKKKKDSKRKKRDAKIREKDEDKEFMNTIEKMLPKEKHDRVASYFTKGKVQMLAQSPTNRKNSKPGSGRLSPIKKTSSVDSPYDNQEPTHDTEIEPLSPKHSSSMEKQELDEAFGDFEEFAVPPPEKAKRDESSSRPNSRQNEPFKITLAHPTPKEDQKESDAIVEYRLEMQIAPWLRANEQGVGEGSCIEEMLKDSSYFTLTSIPRTTCELSLACPLPCDNITDFRTGQHVVHIDHENLHDFSIPEPKRIEVDATRWKELFQDNREPPCPAPATTSIDRMFVPQEHSPNPDEWALTKLSEIKDKYIPDPSTVRLDTSSIGEIGVGTHDAETSEQNDSKNQKSGETQTKSGNKTVTIQEETIEKSASPTSDITKSTTRSKEQDATIIGPTKIVITDGTSIQSNIDVNSLTLQVLKELQKQPSFKEDFFQSEEGINQVANVIANIVQSKLKSSNQSVQNEESIKTPQSKPNQPTRKKITPQGTRPTLYNQDVVQGARVNQTTVGTAIMEAKLSGLRQKVGGTIPITASVDPYNAATSLSTINDTNEFGGPKARTIARPAEHVPRESPNLPQNSQPPPQMYQPPNQVMRGYVGSGYVPPENGMNLQMPGPMPDQMNNMMMNPMMMQQMQQMMMMQQMQNPMMMQQMQNSMMPPQMQQMQPPRTEQLQVPSRRGTGRSGSRSVRSTGSNPQAPNRAMVKELFSKALNGRYRQVEELFAKGMSADTIDENGNTVLLKAAQNGNKKLIKTCLRYGGDVNFQNKQGQTALHFCFAYKYEELAAYLISKGAEDTIQNSFGYTCYDGLRPPAAK